MEKINLSSIMCSLRYPNTVAFTVTHKCNLKCTHCFNNSESSKTDDLTDDELIKIAKEIAELNPINVCLCGGEPLLRGAVIYDIIKVMKGNVGNINIVSNGYNTSEETMSKLKEAGINLIQFSLDGGYAVEHDTFRCKNGAFDRVIKSIKWAKRAGLGVGISFVPNKMNKESLIKAIDICRQLKVNVFRVMPMIPMGRGAQAEFLLLNSDEYITLQQTLELEKHRGNLFIEWGDPIDHLHRMPINTENGYPAHSVEIRYDGKVTPSSYLPIVAGDAVKDSLSQLWDEKLCDIWGNKELVKLATSIENVYDFNEFPKCPFSEDGDFNI